MTEVEDVVNDKPVVSYRETCKVCLKSEREAVVNSDIREGKTDAAVLAHLLRLKLTPQRGPTAVTLAGIRRHRESNGDHPWCHRARGRRRVSKSSQVTDLAVLVRDKTLESVLSGRLEPTLQHGLMAQAMLDKRVERAADRQLAVTLAGMLAGAVAPARIIIPGVAREASAGLLSDGLDPDDAEMLG
jgi:hypothetical protein